MIDNYELDVIPIINWTNPIIVPIDRYYPTVPEYPWYTTSSGTYNIDIT